MCSIAPRIRLSVEGEVDYCILIERNKRVSVRGKWIVFLEDIDTSPKTLITWVHAVFRSLLLVPAL